MTAYARRRSSRVCRGVRRKRQRCRWQWSAISWPAAAISEASCGRRSTCSPTRKKVACAAASSSRSRTAGVACGWGRGYRDGRARRGRRGAARKRRPRRGASRRRWRLLRSPGAGVFSSGARSVVRSRVSARRSSPRRVYLAERDGRESLPCQACEELLERLCVALCRRAERQHDDVAAAEGAGGAAAGRADARRSDDRSCSDVAAEQILTRGEARRGSQIEQGSREAEGVCVVFEFILGVEPVGQCAWPQLGERLVARDHECLERLPAGPSREREGGVSVSLPKRRGEARATSP